MSETELPKAGVYVPAGYILVRGGYELADSAPYSCLPLKDGHPGDKLLTKSDVDISAVEEDEATNRAENTGLESVQEVLSRISSQIFSLAEAQSRSEKRLSRVEKLCKDNASQSMSFKKGQFCMIQLLKNLADDHQGQVQSLTETQAANMEELQQIVAAIGDLNSRFNDWHSSQAENQAVPIKSEYGGACTHNVHPPPRKINRPVVGYDYGTGNGSGNYRVDKAPGLLQC